jgi:hypothetical protein
VEGIRTQGRKKQTDSSTTSGFQTNTLELPLRLCFSAKQCIRPILTIPLPTEQTQDNIFISGIYSYFYSSALPSCSSVSSSSYGRNINSISRSRVQLLSYRYARFVATSSGIGVGKAGRGTTVEVQVLIMQPIMFFCS